MFVPPEIVSIIVSHLPTSSIADFRMTNKTFAIMGLPYLVPVVSVKFLPESLSRFTQISQHPILSCHVTEVILIKDVVGNHATIWQWQNSIHRHRPWPRPANDTDLEELHAQHETPWEQTWGSHNIYPFHDDDARIDWQCQKNVRAQQQTLMGPGRPGLVKLLRCFGEAIPRLPRLRTVRLASCPDGLDSLGHRRLAIEHQQRYMYSESLSAEGLFVGVSQLWSLLKAGAERPASTRIKHLSAYELHVNFFDPDDWLFQPSCVGASSLTSLGLDLSLSNKRVYSDWQDETYEDDNESLEDGGVKMFLNALPCLKSLRLCFWTIGELTSGPKFKHILDGVMLPKLQDLDIAKLQATSEEFSLFFSVHAACLRRAKLKDICLINEDHEEHPICWSDVLGTMRHEVRFEAITFSGNLETLLPRSKMRMDDMAIQYPNTTLNKIFAGFLLDKDQDAIFGKDIGTNSEASNGQKLDLTKLKDIMDLAKFTEVVDL